MKSRILTMTYRKLLVRTGKNKHWDALPLRSQTVQEHAVEVVGVEEAEVRILPLLRYLV